MYNEYIVLKGYALVGYSLGNDTYARRFKGKGFIVTNMVSVCVKAQNFRIGIFAFGRVGRGSAFQGIYRHIPRRKPYRHGGADFRRGLGGIQGKGLFL